MAVIVKKRQNKKTRRNARARIAAKPAWKEFEEAVAQFIQQLDPTAQVEYNKQVPHVLTGEPRQADAWIEQRVCNLFPVKILVSCKHHRRRLGSRDIGTFKSEVNDLGATFGVIYSRGGFYKPAIEAAKKQGITCCRLYRDDPADIPEVITWAWFACRQRFEVRAVGQPQELGGTWDAFLTQVINRGGRSIRLIDETARLLREEELKQRTGTGPGHAFPKPFAVHVPTDDSREHAPFLEVSVEWDHFKAKDEVRTLAGSYCYTDGRFTGKESTPPFDFQEFPGTGWDPISGPPDPPPTPCGVFAVHKGNIADLLVKHFRGQAFVPGNQKGEIQGSSQRDSQN